MAVPLRRSGRSNCLRSWFSNPRPRVRATTMRSTPYHDIRAARRRQRSVKVQAPTRSRSLEPQSTASRPWPTSVTPPSRPYTRLHCLRHGAPCASARVASTPTWMMIHVASATFGLPFPVHPARAPGVGGDQSPPPTPTPPSRRRTGSAAASATGAAPHPPVPTPVPATHHDEPMISRPSPPPQAASTLCRRQRCRSVPSPSSAAAEVRPAPPPKTRSPPPTASRFGGGWLRRVDGAVANAATPSHFRMR